MKFTIETQKRCPNCKRDIDAVRVHGDEREMFPGLRLSRHFPVGQFRFCTLSLEAVK